MKLCHAMDIRFDRLASGVVLQATCYAAGCGRMYARLIPKGASLTADLREFYRSRDDWSSLLTVRQFLDEMRCTAVYKCDACDGSGCRAMSHA